MRTPFGHSLRALLAALAFGACAQGMAQSGSNVISYQGALRYQGQLANGAFDLRFRLLSAASGGSPVGSVIELDNVPVRGGQFATKLDFGVNVFNGQELFLELSTRLGNSTGNYTTLAPTQEITAVPFAMLARSVAANGVSSAAIVDGSVGSADINSAQVQRRVGAGCAASQAVRQINADGSVLCETVAGAAGGDITSVTAGTGLSGGAQSGDVNLAVNFSQVQARVSESCQPGYQLRGVNQDGSLRCEFVRLPPSSLLVNDSDLPQINYGRFPSIVIAPDGLAQIAHGFERFLYLTTCLDSACTRSISRRVFSQQATINFVKIKMAVGADGIPSIAFSGANTAANSRTFLLRCLDADCAATAPVRDFGAIGEVLAIQLAPIGAAQLLVRTINNGLRLHRCADAACTSDQASTLVSDGGLVTPVEDGDMRVIAGRLQIVTAVGDRVRYFSCTDATCSIVPSAVTLLGPGNGAIRTVALTETGARLPQVFFSTIGAGSGAIFCPTLNCAISNPSVPIPRSDVSFGMSAITGTDRDGLAVLLSRDQLTGFTATQCATPTCSTLFSRSLEACAESSAVMAPDGLPIIACHAESESQLKVIKCNSPGCL
jgi:hypothetical protein